MRILNRVWSVCLIGIVLFGCIIDQVEEKNPNGNSGGNSFENAKSLVITDAVFTGGIEGPAMNSNGDLFVVNFQQEGTIGVLKKDSSKFEIFVELSNGSIGNGIRFDDKDNMYIADYVNNNILFIENGTKEVEVYCHNDSINQPNDLVLHENGFGFASDPNWEQSKGNLIKFSEGKMEIVESDMGTTNGIELSPDGKTLYVNESVQTKIWKYDVSDNGELTNKSVFIDFEGFGMDGMRCDSKGNLFLARYGKGVVSIISKTGDLIKEISLNGEKPTNVTFPNGNDNELYITIQDKKWVEKITF